MVATPGNKNISITSAGSGNLVKSPSSLGRMMCYVSPAQKYMDTSFWSDPPYERSTYM